MKRAIVILCFALAPMTGWAQNLRDYQDRDTTVITVRDMSECPVSRQNPMTAEAEATAETAGGGEHVVVRAPSRRIVCMTLHEVAVRCATARMGFNAEMLTYAGTALTDSGELHITIRPNDAQAQFCDDVRRVNEARRLFLHEVAQKREHYDGALSAARADVAAHPDDPARQHELMAELMNVGDVELAASDLADARSHYAESQTLARTLLAASPDNPSLQWDLYSSTVKLANLEARAGDEAAALRIREDGLALAERVAAQNTDAPAWRRAVYVGAAELGEAQVRSGDASAARRRLERSLALARAEPTSAQSQRDIAAILLSLGAAQRAQGDLPGAQQSFEASLAARRTQTDAQTAHDVAMTLDALGDVQIERQDFTSAAATYQESFERARRVAAADPRNPDKQRALALAAQHVGDAQAGLHNVVAAREAYQQSLDIARRLARLLPNVADRRRDVWVAMQRMAANVPGSVSWSDVADYMERLDRHGLLAPSDKHWLEQAQAAAHGAAPSRS